MTRLAPALKRAVLWLQPHREELLESWIRAVTDVRGIAQAEAEAPKRSGLGIDLSHGMLRRGAEKLRRRGFSDRTGLVRGDAERLPVRDVRFDGAMVAFGIRNVGDPLAALREVHRALRPGGSLVVLEFSTPGGLFGSAYRFYFRRILPLLAGILSDRSAYAYLPASVERFPSPNDFAMLMRAAGFREVRWQPLTGGIACLHRGEKGRGLPD